MNIYDVSEKAGVSIATVSRVLNGNLNVSDKTRSRVLEVMKELGYTPNVFARGLGLNTMRTVGIMCSDSSDPYLARAIGCLERELRANSYDALLCCTGDSLDTRQNYIRLLLSKRVDSVILAGSKFVERKPRDNAYILDAARSIPVMLVNGCLDGSGIYSTVCDDRGAMYQAAEGLITSGHPRILYLYSSRSYSGRNKLRGYEDALAAHGLPRSEELIRQCPKDVLAARQLLISLWDDGLRFDGVLTSDDSLAVGAVKFAHEKQLSIPDTLSIIGYNNSILSVCTDPEITTVDTRVESLCTTSVHTLMGVLAGGNVPGRTTISADLIRRQTTHF